MFHGSDNEKIKSAPEPEICFLGSGVDFYFIDKAEPEHLTNNIKNK